MRFPTRWLVLVLCLVCTAVVQAAPEVPPVSPVPGALPGALPGAGAPLAQYIPADAVAYVGWRGADQLGPAYNQSNLKAVLDASGLDELFTRSLPALMRNPKVQREMDGQARDFLAKFQQWGPAVWHTPCAIFFDGVDFPKHGPSQPRLGILFKAGPNAAALRDMLKQAVASYRGPKDHQPRLIDDGKVLGLTTAVAQLPKQAAQSLAQSQRFTQTMTQVRPNGALVAYADVKSLLKILDELQARIPVLDPTLTQQRAQHRHKIQSALGLDGLDTAAWSMGFDGRDWQGSLYVHTTGPHKGLLSLLDAAPITTADLAGVPASAGWVYGEKLDPAALLDIIRQVATAADPHAVQAIDRQLAQVKRQMNIDVEKDLLQGLGTTWLAYSEREAVGPGLYNLCITNTLRKPASVKRVLDQVAMIANAMIHGQSRPGEPQFKITTATLPSGTQLHTMHLFFISPCWAVTGGKLYVALVPQVIAEATSAQGQARPSITTTVAFQKQQQRLGNHKPLALSYTNLPQTAPSAYPGLLMVGQMAQTALTVTGVNPPAVLVPPLSAIQPHLRPAGWQAWSDADGLHIYGVSPFPGSMMLASQQGLMSISGVALATGIMLPALGAARKTARQAKVQSQARQLLIGVTAYSVDHNGRMPKNMTVLFHGHYLQDPHLLITSFSHRQVPPDFRQWPAAKQDAWIHRNSSFVLTPNVAGKDMSQIKKPSQTVALFAKPEDSGGNSTGVGFADGHVDWMPTVQAEALIKKQTGKSIKQLVDEAEHGNMKIHVD